MATRRLQFGEVGEQGDVPVRKEQEVIVEEATRCNLGMQQDVAENQLVRLVRLLGKRELGTE
jgi:hypothetical protein